jgi:hypothetical protein
LGEELPNLIQHAHIGRRAGARGLADGRLIDLMHGGELIAPVALFQAVRDLGGLLVASFATAGKQAGA